MNATTPSALLGPTPADDTLRAPVGTKHPLADTAHAPVDTGHSPPDATSSSRPLTGRLRPRHAVWAGGLLLLVVAVIWTSHYWAVGRFIESTDDAYVKADSTTVAPKVSGYIAEVLVDDNQPVKAGQVVALIDARDLQTASSEADASLAAASAVVANLAAQLVAQDDLIREAQADLQVEQTAVELARRNDSRRREMAKVGFGSDEQSDEASTDLRKKMSGVIRAEAAVASARQQVEVLKTQRQLADAQRLRALAMQHQAGLNLGYATIRAAIDGTVGARSVRVGQFVQAGTQLMEIVPLRQIYIVANFKETQLTRMHSGETARIAIDAFPDNALTARVASLAPASGLEFSLLPPDNATGNFTKIVQRVPVKLFIDDVGKLSGRLRPGMSVNVEVDTREGPAREVGAAKPSSANTGAALVSAAAVGPRR